MKKEFHKFSFILCFGLVFTFLLVTIALPENITFTTYYPAPFGVYNEMRVNKLVIGDPDPTLTPSPNTDGVTRFKGIGSDPAGSDDTEPGTLYYNSSDNEFKYYDGTGWQALGGGGGCYVTYSGACLTGFTMSASAGSWGNCSSYYAYSSTYAHFRPPGGGCRAGWYSSNIGQAYVCCQ